VSPSVCQIGPTVSYCLVVPGCGGRTAPRTDRPTAQRAAAAAAQDLPLFRQIDRDLEPFKATGILPGMVDMASQMHASPRCKADASRARLDGPFAAQLDRFVSRMDW
jgi:hypothetical protein